MFCSRHRVLSPGRDFAGKWQVGVLLGLALAIVAVFLVDGPLRGADTPRKPPAEPKTLRELIDTSMAWYEIFPNAEANQAAQVTPVLRWANNARGSEDGVTILYLHDGLPLAASCAYPWAQRLEHDFHSLSRGKLIARYNGVVFWQPQEAGVRFTDLPGAPAPDGTRTGRLRQMKILTERFRAIMTGWKADSTDREELRLLPKPLFRYEPKSGPIIDGAVFAFVMGTDPEVLLQLEAVKTGEKVVWQYGFSRRTSGRLEGRLDGAVVWNADHFPVQNDPRRPNFTRGVPLPPEIEIGRAHV